MDSSKVVDIPQVTLHSKYKDMYFLFAGISKPGNPKDPTNCHLFEYYLHFGSWDEYHIT